MDLDDLMADSNARARRGRILARDMFVGVVFVLLAAAFLFVAAPHGPRAMTADPGLIAVAIPALAIVGLVVGLAWMVRILRSDPEPDTNAWRYRRR